MEKMAQDDVELENKDDQKVVESSVVETAVKDETKTSFECDFDQGPTDLYSNLQKREWEATIKRSHEAPKEARTWVSRSEQNGKLRWRLLPLHAAIIFKAPESVIEALLGAYPKGAECKDDQGMLPLHLAFRHGSTEGIVNLLLVAYPQSIDVKDRKGRIPLVLAQASTSPNRDAFMRALERGPTYYAVAAAATERAAVTAELRAIFDAKLIEIKNNHAHEVETLRKESETKKLELEDKIDQLEQELGKTQETSQVLVDHVNSLEAQLSSRSDTERFLATKIATLDSSLRDVSRVKEENENSFQAENGSLRAENLELKSKMETLTKEHKEAIDIKTACERKVEEISGVLQRNAKKSEDSIQKLEIEWASAKANGAILESQLKRKIETEHSLASQVSALAQQLAESASEASKVNGNYVGRIHTLETERNALRSTVVSLTKKLSHVVTVLESMTDEQDKLVQNATLHEEVMVKAASTHAKIVADASRQEDFFNKARNERKELMELLGRQREEMEAVETERANILAAVKAQGEQMAVSRSEREVLLSGVERQKQLVSDMVKNELFMVPKSIEGQDDDDIVNEVIKRAKDEANRVDEEDQQAIDRALEPLAVEDDGDEKPAVEEDEESPEVEDETPQEEEQEEEQEEVQDEEQEEEETEEGAAEVTEEGGESPVADVDVAEGEAAIEVQHTEKTEETGEGEEDEKEEEQAEEEAEVEEQPEEQEEQGETEPEEEKPMAENPTEEEAETKQEEKKEDEPEVQGEESVEVVDRVEAARSQTVA